MASGKGKGKTPTGTGASGSPPGDAPIPKRSRTSSSTRPSRAQPPREPTPPRHAPSPVTSDEEVDTLDIQFVEGTGQRARFMEMNDRTLLPTRFADKGDLVKLGLWETTRDFFHNIGWEKFLATNFVTYTRPTLEALSSFKKGVIMISFRMMNKDCTIYHDSIREIFGFPAPLQAPNGRYLTPALLSDGGSRFPNTFDKDKFWCEITGLDEPFRANSSKSAAIIHPVLRYAQRVLATSIFARTDLGYCSVSELCILWAMTQPRVAGEDGVLRPAVYIDAAGFICHHLAKTAAASTEICCGAFFTAFARTCGVSWPPSAPSPIGEVTVTIDTLRRSHILRPAADGGWIYLVSTVPYLRLPHPHPLGIVEGEREWLRPAATTASRGIAHTARPRDGSGPSTVREEAREPSETHAARGVRAEAEPQADDATDDSSFSARLDRIEATQREHGRQLTEIFGMVKKIFDRVSCTGQSATATVPGHHRQGSPTLGENAQN